MSPALESLEWYLCLELPGGARIVARMTKEFEM
jgi:hypothetical protein